MQKITEERLDELEITTDACTTTFNYMRQQLDRLMNKRDAIKNTIGDSMNKYEKLKNQLDPLAEIWKTKAEYLERELHNFDELGLKNLEGIKNAVENNNADFFTMIKKSNGRKRRMRAVLCMQKMENSLL